MDDKQRFINHRLEEFVDDAFYEVMSFIGLSRVVIRTEAVGRTEWMP